MNIVELGRASEEIKVKILGEWDGMMDSMGRHLRTM